jgi:hypothetical protein
VPVLLDINVSVVLITLFLITNQLSIRRLIYVERVTIVTVLLLQLKKIALLALICHIMVQHKLVIVFLANLATSVPLLALRSLHRVQQANTALKVLAHQLCIAEPVHIVQQMHKWHSHANLVLLLVQVLKPHVQIQILAITSQTVVKALKLNAQ